MIRHFIRWMFVVLIAGSVVAAQWTSPVSAQRRKATQKKPNIIFILADDLGYGDLGSYGQKYIKTPNLDRMAREGVRFTQAYASCPVCAPSRASLMTGLHQGHAYIRGNTDRNNQRVSLRSQDTTMGDVMKKAGYRTGVIGKWGLGEPNTTGIPNRKGFDYWFGYLNQNLAHNYYPDSLWRDGTEVSLPKGTYSHDLFTAEALDFVKRERAGPFFLYLAYTIPHANNELHRRTGNGMEVPDDAPYTKENWSQQQKNYAAMVTRMDRDIGRLFDLLKELKIDDNTLVVFSSDNGPQDISEGGYDQKLFDSNGQLRGLKRELYEGGIREPTIARWPGHVPARTVSDQYWAQYDLLPTFAAVAGTSPPQGLDGISVLPLLLGRAQQGHQFLYWEFHEGAYSQAVRMGRWKGVRHGAGGPLELYDLETDIAETRNLAGARPEIAARIADIMKREHIESALWPDAKGD